MVLELRSCVFGSVSVPVSIPVSVAGLSIDRQLGAFML